MGYIVFDKKNNGVKENSTYYNDLLSSKFRTHSHLLRICDYFWRDNLSESGNKLEVKSQILSSYEEISLKESFENVFIQDLLKNIEIEIFKHINGNISNSKRNIEFNAVSKNLLDIILDNFGDSVSDENINIVLHSQFIRDLEDIKWFRPYVGYGNVIGYLVNMPVRVSDSIINDKFGNPMILVGEKDNIEIAFDKDIRFHTQYPYNGYENQLSSSVIFECKMKNNNFLTLER